MEDMHPPNATPTGDSRSAPAADRNDPASALNDDFSHTARALFAAGSREQTLAQVVALAIATIEGCDYAGIFLVDGVEVTTPVRSHPLVGEVDALQHHHGEGPCLDAMSRGVTFYAEDLAGDARWPHFGPEATSVGVRSVLALPLYADETFGALNLYAAYPSAFGVLDRARGQLLAALAALALSSARSHEDEERRSANLHTALDTREVIGQAQGILMERERISADKAFDILRRASQHLNVKLREVAQKLVDTGERPETGS